MHLMHIGRQTRMYFIFCINTCTYEFENYSNKLRRFILQILEEKRKKENMLTESLNQNLVPPWSSPQWLDVCPREWDIPSLKFQDPSKLEMLGKKYDS